MKYNKAKSPYVKIVMNPNENTRPSIVLQRMSRQTICRMDVFFIYYVIHVILQLIDIIILTFLNTNIIIFKQKYNLSYIIELEWYVICAQTAMVLH